MIDLDDALRPRWLFGRTVREGCNRAGFYEQGDFATEYGDDHRCLVKLGCKGPVVKCNVPIRGWVRRHRRLPERRRHLHGLHDAGLPRQVHAVHGGGHARARSRRTSTQLHLRPDPPDFRHRNIKKKYDKEPEWRKPGATLDDRLPAPALRARRRREES